MREGDFVSLSYSTRNPIEFTIPELLYQDGGILSVPSENSTSASQSSCLSKLLNIWSTDWIHRSLYDEGKFPYPLSEVPTDLVLVSSSYSFLRLLGSSAKEAHALHLSPLISRRLSAVHDEAGAADGAPYYS